MHSKWTVQEVFQSVKHDWGSIDIIVHSIEECPEVLAFEAGRRQGIRVNTISAGPQRILGGKLSVFIDRMIEYSATNAPLKKELKEVGNTAAFLSSPLASAITGAVIHVDNGLNAMGAGNCCCMFDDLHF
ncbi:Enoyl-[acyl-carrier-protein] reductase [NADH], chloroplastic [Morella rubra]|uniref:Enoyl-[acyl-carrier-protein] reductase [NADH], chloroplastic n=1 Tax=Morella rubra TaxID=262757 RepID=A0A6A1VA12_9ROSI|nr:Enoyl-[acyl-carrier-protein] reductase [NADH], chloroplastic [Morella rubra]KAB1209574.1 Enoyl-[acyl-carrier-protein] reductase [NADH], chloroplastic [Morella rubra]